MAVPFSRSDCSVRNRGFRWTLFLVVLALAGVPDPGWAQRVVQITSGYTHNAMLREDGTVWVMGNNNEGQLGDGTRIAHPTPVAVPGITGVRQVVAGGFFTLVLTNGGTVLAWGNNDYGQLGDGTTQSRSIPKPIPGLSGVTTIAAGAYHAFALKADGSVWAWGFNGFGQLGDGSLFQRSAPVPLVGLANVTAIAAGASHTIALRSDGTVWSWGLNSSGQLGDGTTANRSAPAPVPGLTGATAVAAGWHHSGALRSDATVRIWGYNEFGQVGDGSTSNRTSPVVVPGLTGVAEIRMGGNFTAARHNDGTLRTWGSNEWGQLGTGNKQNRAVPAQVPGLTGLVSVQTTSYGVFALRNDGSMYAWGNNDYGQNATGKLHDEPVHPLEAQGLSAVQSLAVGGFHFLALKNDGTVLAWGANYRGQLGDGGTLNRLAPQLVAGATGVTAIAGGRYHNLARRQDGSVLAWGANSNGQLGDGTTVDRLTAVTIPNLTGVSALAGGGAHSVALKSDGTVWTWGKNDHGQLGDGTTTQRLQPAQVAGLTGVAAISAGDAFTMARKSDGTVWTWGANDFGQMGDGTTQDRLTPRQVPNLASATDIAAGWFHALALQTNATVKAWGYNASGQLGDGTMTTRLSPVASDAGNTVVHVAAGANYSVALNANGSVRAWGGAGANGFMTDEPIPQRLPFVRNVTSLHAGGSCTLIATAQARFYTWGNCAGDPIESVVPEPVLDLFDPTATRGARPVVEFLNDRIGQGHHFITASFQEAQGIDAGAAGAGWARTGRAWRAWTMQPEVPAGVNAMPVYRFYAAGPNSHFFTVSEAEKDSLLAMNPTRNPALGWALEGTVFYAVPPIPATAATPAANQMFGATCPADYYPVFRAYNNRFAFNDSNHTITSNYIDILRGLRFFGWIDEGIAFCAPKSTTRGGDLQAYHTFPGDQAASGSAMVSEHFFENAGPGEANGAVIHAALPQGMPWVVTCEASFGATCPTPAELAAVDNLALGIRLASLPAGGMIKLIAKAGAPAMPQILEFASAIDTPIGAPDPLTTNNETSISKTTVITAQFCTATLSAPSLAALAGGTAGIPSQVALSAPSGCGWTITSSEAFVHVSPASGSGSAAISVSVDPNGATTQRAAKIVATANANAANRYETLVSQAGAAASVPSAPPQCDSVRLDQEAVQLGPNTIQSAVALTTTQCAWEAKASGGWITLTRSASGVGGATIQYQVQPNAGEQERKGFIEVVNKRLDIMQAGQSTLAPDSENTGPGDGGGGSGGGGGGGGGGSGGGSG